MAGQTDNKARAAIDANSLERGLETPQTIDSTHESETKPDQPPEAPEGGTKAYMAVAGAALSMFVSFGWVNCVALFQAEYETNQLKDYTSSEVSWITSMECTYTTPCQELVVLMPLSVSLLHAFHLPPGWVDVR